MIRGQGPGTQQSPVNLEEEDGITIAESPSNFRIS